MIRLTAANEIPLYLCERQNIMLRALLLLKQKKQQSLLNKWISEKQSSTYISVDDSYKNAKFRFKNWIK